MQRSCIAFNKVVATVSYLLTPAGASLKTGEMKKINFLYLLLLLCSSSGFVYAQSGWLPPVYFPPGQYLCDTNRWRLVLSDDFDGNKIDTGIWYTFNTNNWGDNDDWGDARIEVYGENTTIVKDENVQVSEGTLKLKVKQETSSWKCNSCPGTPQTRNYTSGYIGSKMRFNKGAKIETRLRMPIFEGSWNTCWLWGMNEVNEIDFAESWSNKGMPSWPYIGKHRPHVNYSLHSWRPKSDTNKYLPGDIDIPNRYPGQEWWDWMSNNRFRYEDWHKYTCEWDTASVTIYLDDVAINKFWKYYREVSIPVYDPYREDEVYAKVKQPAICTPQAGEWQITKGYPWNSENSVSKLIFSVAATKKDKIHDTPHPVDLGQMEIDYVRVYQRHPEEDGHREIYEGSGRAGGSSEVMSKDPLPAKVFTSRNVHLAAGQQNFNLWLSTNVPGKSYYWKIWYGRSGAEHYYEASGQYVSTPAIYQEGTSSYYLRWEVQLTSSESTQVISGAKEHASGGPLLSDVRSFMSADSTCFNLEARFNTAEDWSQYLQSVEQALSNTFIENVEDPAAVSRLVNRVKIRCLEPYLYFEEEAIDDGGLSLIYRVPIFRPE